MKIFIKNMVSLRCKMMVESELENLGITYKSIKLGEVLLDKPITETNYAMLKITLHKSGLELIHDEKAIMIEKIIINLSSIKTK